MKRLQETSRMEFLILEPEGLPTLSIKIGFAVEDISHELSLS